MAAMADTSAGAVPQGVPMQVTPNTPTRRPLDAPTGETPLAKRPMQLTLVATPDGPAMDHGQLSKAIYELNRKFMSIEQWGTNINDVVEEHAGQLDRVAERVRG